VYIEVILNEREVALRTEYHKLIQTGLADNPPTIPANRVDTLTSTLVEIIRRDDLGFNRAYRLDPLEKLLVRGDG